MELHENNNDGSVKNKTIFILLLFILNISVNKAQIQSVVRFVEDGENKKIDVFFGNNYFTSYIYPDNMEKQVLYPIVTTSGKEITRGYPLKPRPFERVDHPHQIGLWFNFGNVNGLDFWNNSFDVKPEEKHRYGSIKFKRIVKSLPDSGTLVVASDWRNCSGEVLLNEISTYVFNEENGVRTIERIIELKALVKVVFTDNKEGMLGLRMDRAFEEPAKVPGRFLDGEGNITGALTLYNEGVNGMYRNAEGVLGSEVWGKRSPWVAVSAEIEGEVVTVVILDHHENINFPAWSHARGYGLFATNNLAGRAVDKNSEPAKMELKKGEKVIFKYNVLVGGDLTDQQISQIADYKNKIK